MGKVIRPFCWHQNFFPKGCLPCPGATYRWKNKKICIKSKMICLKLPTDGQNDKGFLLTSKVCPQGVFCPCPGAVYMYTFKKSLNVYKIRFWRDHFETCNIWAKRKGLSVIIKILSPVDCLSLPGVIYIWWNTKRKYIKLDYKEIYFKPATNGQVIKISVDINICPQGVVSSCPKCIKGLKYIPGPGVSWAFTGPLVLWFNQSCLMTKPTKWLCA